MHFAMLNLFQQVVLTFKLTLIFLRNHPLLNFQHAVIAIPDERKGEALVLITTKQNTTSEEVARAIRSSGANELMIPKQIMTREELPLLGTGKTDYVALKSFILKQKS